MHMQCEAGVEMDRGGDAGKEKPSNLVNQSSDEAGRRLN